MDVFRSFAIRDTVQINCGINRMQENGLPKRKRNTSEDQERIIKRATNKTCSPSTTKGQIKEAKKTLHKLQSVEKEPRRPRTPSGIQYSPKVNKIKELFLRSSSDSAIANSVKEASQGAIPLNLALFKCNSQSRLDDHRTMLTPDTINFNLNARADRQPLQVQSASFDGVDYKGTKQNMLARNNHDQQQQQQVQTKLNAFFTTNSHHAEPSAEGGDKDIQQMLHQSPTEEINSERMAKGSTTLISTIHHECYKRTTKNKPTDFRSENGYGNV